MTSIAASLEISTDALVPTGAPSFGALTPLMAPRATAVIGASDRDGNLGGLAVDFLTKFGYRGPVWPVNPGHPTVRGKACFASVRDLPGIPDLAIIAVPAERVLAVALECAEVGIPSAIVWAGGFAEIGAEGAERQRELAQMCRARGLRLVGPNCIGIINSSIGLAASFSSLLVNTASLSSGSMSMVSQSGGIAVTALARAQARGLGFRVTASVGNEAVLGIADFVHALAADNGTRVIALYVESLSDPNSFVAALDAARAKGKPLIVLKGGATESAGRAAFAHTGRLAGSSRTFDAVCREFSAIRVHSTEEMLDVGLQLASMPEGQRHPATNRVLITSFGGGSGVVCTDQCERAGLAVPALTTTTKDALKPLVTPLSSVANPIDFTPGMVTSPRYRMSLPAALENLGDLTEVDSWLFLAAGFDRHAPEVVELYDAARRRSPKPILLTWDAMPPGTSEALAARGIHVFNEHGRAAKTLGHIVDYSAALRRRTRKLANPLVPFDWTKHVGGADGPRVISEHTVATLLIDAGLPVAAGRFASSADDARRAAQEVGLPVAMKGLSPAITHRAAAGLVALDLDSEERIVATERRFQQRAAELGVELDGVWVQHMFEGTRELLITAFRDTEFGIVVGCGIGGGATELVDDVVFARAPLDTAGAFDLIGELRTLRRIPSYLSEQQQGLAADFLARFSGLAATAPWSRFTLEVNPLKLGDQEAAAVDGLLVIE